MRFSIVVPSYNQAPFIRNTLDSVLSQHCDDIEVLVFDRRSNDGTVEILKSYGNRIRFVSRKDHGLPDAINQGLLSVTGDILAYLNPDDVYLPGALERVARHFRDNPHSLCAYGQAFHLHEDGSCIDRYYSEPWSYERLLDICYICQPAVFWRRRVIEQFGIFDDTLHWALDYDYWLRLGRAFPFDYLEDAFLAGSGPHNSTKTLSERVKVHEEILQVVMRYSKRPPIRWLMNLAAVITEEITHQFQDRVSQKTMKALMIEAATECADRYQIPIGTELLDQFEGWL